MSSAILDGEFEILQRAVMPGSQLLSRDAAESLLRIHFAANDVERMNVLAEKARLGELTPQEQAQLDAYERVGHLLSTLRSFARRSL